MADEGLVFDAPLTVNVIGVVEAGALFEYGRSVAMPSPAYTYRHCFQEQR
jgi:hypothetical protein